MRRALVAVLVAAVVAVSLAAGTPAQAPRRGGTIVFGGLGEPACLNVLLARCYVGRAGHLSFLVEEVLERTFDVGPDFAYRPRLVSSVTFTKNPPFTLTYRIHPRARWSDGRPVTASDFLFTQRAMLSQKAQLSTSDRVLLEQIRRVRVVNAKTVKVVLRSRFAGWRGLFGTVLPQHALAGENLEKIWTDRIDNPKTGSPIGSGPFLVERWERGRQLTLVRNPRYWGAHPAYLDRLVIRFRLEGDDAIDWFRRDELDVAWAFFGGVSAPALRRESDLRVLAPPGQGYDHLAIRVGPGGHRALRSKLVRRALAYGIDRVALVRQVLGDTNGTLRPLDNIVLLKPSRFYRPNWSGYRHRPAEARRLLEQAGCRRSADGIYSCGGERLSLRFVTTAGVPPRERALSLVQAQLRQVGVEVVPSFAAGPAFFEQILPSGEFDVALFAWRYDPSKTGLKDIFGCGGPDNFTGYCQRLVTRDLDQADRILDAGQQARSLNRADAQMARDVPAIPLWQIPLPTALRTSVRGFVVSPYNPISTAENWWLER